ncbi:MAG: hypothetical protein LQ346_001520 [Caloplaca aetnensis]|nr:MAG: hypothetical protein LQ346_001520 [Caloplaca aetnensis]
MATTSKRTVTAEVSFGSLKNCLVNLPQSLVNVLVQTNAPAQDVVVEILANDSAAFGKNGPGIQRSVYVGWTGMPSARQSPSFASHRHEQGPTKEPAIMDIDATFGRMLGLAEGQKVGLLLHLDPPLAYTVNIEPLTPGDWEVIELHANFLELNLLSQIRALPNPSYSASPSAQVQHLHPLTLHLSPTSTANIIVTSLVPPLSASQPFAKIAADTEVIVAPKSRPRLSERNGSRSAASMGMKSASGRSGRSSGHRADPSEKYLPSMNLLLRPCDRRYCAEAFDPANDEADENVGLRIWVDPEAIGASPGNNVSHVSVSIVKPAVLEKPMDPQQQQKRKELESSEARKPASTVVARLCNWRNSVGSTHAALSSLLCSSLQAGGIVGGLVQVQAAPPPLSKRVIKSLQVVPFLYGSEHKAESIRIGGQAQVGRDEALRIVQQVFSSAGTPRTSVDQPLTDGLLLPPLNQKNSQHAWRGGILRFSMSSGEETERSSLAWVAGLDQHTAVNFGSETANPFPEPGDDGVPDDVALMTGLETLTQQLSSQLKHSSSSLLTGGLGSGKSSLARLLGSQLRSRNQIHVSYLSGHKLMSDEVRVSSVKESLERVFNAASWAVRLGGQSLVILDDLDKLCPAVTELQTQDNSRSNQVSELVCHNAKTHCGRTSGVTLLATAQSQESLNSLLVGANLFKEIVALKAPGKDRRRRLLQTMIGSGDVDEATTKPTDGANRRKSEAEDADHAGWMDGSLPPSPTSSPNHAVNADDRLDLLDVVRQTDGYMPADLALLVSRAKSEALIRSVSADQDNTLNSNRLINNQDFDRALRGFTPASLRNVTLQSSSTTFDSIGGLNATRKLLLETLQYPTLYAPIFASCPLRLRSGLLLYGYPGCGKTLLASAVAGECSLNFISVKGPEILNKYIGASEKSVRDLFDRAESARPCVLFFDEFDSIAPKRGHDSTGVTDRVVNQLLTQMDGAEGLSGVYVLAATSRPDLIDPALLRPGRLDKSILCDLPDFDDRLDILNVISKKLRLDPELLSSKREGLYEIARVTDGYSGADLQAVVYNAHLEAIHDQLGGRGGVSEMKKGTTNGDQAPLSSRKYDILRFRFGLAADSEAVSGGVNRAKEMAEYYAVVAKLEGLRAARRTERRQGRPPAAKRDKEQAGMGEVEGAAAAQEVVVCWRHIQASLASTRSSISARERARLLRLYREFTVGRNGELPNGEGSTEVGGRTSLM